MHLQLKKIAYSMNMFARVFLPVACLWLAGVICSRSGLSDRLAWFEDWRFTDHYIFSLYHVLAAALCIAVARQAAQRGPLRGQWDTKARFFTSIYGLVLAYRLASCVIDMFVAFSKTELAPWQMQLIPFHGSMVLVCALIWIKLIRPDFQGFRKDARSFVKIAPALFCFAGALVFLCAALFELFTLIGGRDIPPPLFFEPFSALGQGLSLLAQMLFQSPDLGWLLGAFFEDIFPWIVFAAICTAFFQGLRKRAAAGKKQS